MQKKNRREVDLKKKNDACIIAEGITAPSPEQGCGIYPLRLFISLFHILKLMFAPSL